MCLNKKVIAALVVAALAVFLIAPGLLGAAVPVLIVAACPLSMLVMMRSMSGGRGDACRADQASTGPDAELAALRAEVDALRADRPASRSAGV